jgi:hypothetical protein
MLLLPIARLLSLWLMLLPANAFVAVGVVAVSDVCAAARISAAVAVVSKAVADEVEGATETRAEPDALEKMLVEHTPLYVHLPKIMCVLIRSLGCSLHI